MARMFSVGVVFVVLLMFVGLRGLVARQQPGEPDEETRQLLESNWIASLAEHGHSHASGGRPELGPSFFGNPTDAVVATAPTGRGTLVIRPDGLKGLRVHINELHDLSFKEADLAADVVSLDVTPYLVPGPNVIQFNRVGNEGSATVTVVVE